MKTVVLSLVLAAVLGTEVSAGGIRAQFDLIVAREQTDPTGAVLDMRKLADTGFAPAMDRMGYYYRQGVGTQMDLPLAREWYTQAASAGHAWSFASVARVFIDLGDGPAALEVLQRATRDRQPGARRLLATAHIDRKLGPASDPDIGRALLEEMVEDGDKNAARDLILRHNWSRVSGRASTAAVASVVETGLAGDPKFAEAGLIYLTRSQDKDRATLQTRAQLLNVPGLRAHIVTSERIHLAADTRPKQFWSEVEVILDQADPQSYGRGAITAFWINKNAWVRVLQKELREQGFYGGRMNGRMTARTIRAQNRFCREAKIWAICATGPLRGATVRAVASEIAARKKRP